MPWCPNCKAEYQTGFTECSDCKVELVEDLKDAEPLIPFFQAEDKKIAEKLVRFFNYSDLNSSFEFDEEAGLYIVSVPPKKQMQAKKLYQAFYFVERERMEKGEVDSPTSEEEGITENSDIASNVNATSESETEEDIPDYEDEGTTEFKSEEDASVNVNSSDALLEEVSASKPLRDTPGDEVNAFDDDQEGSASVYIMKADQYKDLSGTVMIFLFFGVVGLVVVALNMAGIFTFLQGWIPITVMGALFLFFLYVAFSTNQKAKKVQAEIDAENKLTEQINEWLELNVTESFLASIHKDTISEELNYIKKTDAIKEMLIKEFGPMNLAYLDRLIEEFYNNTFE